MAVAFVLAGASRTASDTSPTINRSSTTNGNLNVAVLVLCDGSTISAVPSGWTLRAVSDPYNTDERVYVYTRTTSSSDAATSVWTSTVSSRWVSLIYEFSGADNSSPLDVYGQQANASSTSVTAPSIDPGYLNDMLIWAAGWVGVSATLSGDPTGFTFDSTNGKKAAASNVSGALGYKLYSGGAATGSVVGTLSSAQANGAILLGIKESGATADGGGPSIPDLVTGGTITHEFVSAKTDGADATLVQASDWNANHVVAPWNLALIGGRVTFTPPSGVTEIDIAYRSRIDFTNVGAIQLVASVVDAASTDTQLLFQTSTDQTTWTTRTQCDIDEVGVVTGAADNIALGSVYVRLATSGGDNSNSCILGAVTLREGEVV